MSTKPRLAVHVFRWSSDSDWKGRPYCECGSLRTDAVHQVPEVSEEVRAVERRRIGESE